MASFPDDLSIYHLLVCSKCYLVMIFNFVLQAVIKKTTNKTSFFCQCEMAWEMNDSVPPSTLREDPVTPEPAFSTVADWLDSIKMSQYKEHFSSGGYVSLDSVLYVSVRLVSQSMLGKVWTAFLKTSYMFNYTALHIVLNMGAFCKCGKLFFCMDSIKHFSL